MTNRFFCLLQIVVFSIAGIYSQNLFADQKFVVGKSSKVTFVAKITAGSFTTESKDVTGFIVMDDSGKKIISAEITVPVKSLESGMSIRNDHMQNKYLEAEKFPNIVFSFSDSKTDFQSNTISKIPGEFKIRDVKKPVVIEALIKSSSPQEMEISSDFPLDITNYGIAQPKFAVVKMDTVVQVHTDLHLEKK